jgi:hypothetical protein
MTTSVAATLSEHSHLTLDNSEFGSPDYNTFKGKQKAMFEKSPTTPSTPVERRNGHGPTPNSTSTLSQPEEYRDEHRSLGSNTPADTFTPTSPTDDEAKPARSRERRKLELALRLVNSGSVARDHLALERTFLAYVRTSLAIASTGVGELISIQSIYFLLILASSCAIIYSIRCQPYSVSDGKTNTPICPSLGGYYHRSRNNGTNSW